MNAGDTGFMLICSALVFFYDTWISLFLWRTGAKKECRQHHDGMRSDYGIVGCHVGIVWIFTVFWWKSCRNYWRFPVVWLAWN